MYVSNQLVHTCIKTFDSTAVEKNLLILRNLQFAILLICLMSIDYNVPILVHV